MGLRTEARNFWDPQKAYLLGIRHSPLVLPCKTGWNYKSDLATWTLEGVRYSKQIAFLENSHASFTVSTFISLPICQSLSARVCRKLQERRPVPLWLESSHRQGWHQFPPSSRGSWQYWRTRRENTLQKRRRDLRRAGVWHRIVHDEDLHG